MNNDKRNLEDLSQLILDNATLIIYTWDLEGKITSFNPYAEEVTGYKKEEVIGKSWMELFLEENERKKVPGLIKYVKTGRSLKNVIGNLWITKDNRIIELIWKTCPIFDVNGYIREIISFGTNITEHKSLVKKLNRMAYFDDLTDLPNWKSAERKLNKAMKKLKRTETKGALVSIDIDNFKQVNDTIGYDAANRLLVFISDILRDNKDIYYAMKFNEDEFGVFFHDIKDMEDARERVHKLMDAIRQPWCADGYNFQISVSMGVSIFPDNGENLSDLKKHANMAMNKVKENGKNGYMFYHEDMKRNVEKNIFIVNNIKDSIENGYFILHYQPIVDLKDNSVYGFESLIRWFHPEKGFISPMEFIPLIEETGQIIDLTSMIFKIAFEQKNLWNKRGYKDTKLSINISSKSFVEENLCEEIKSLLAEYNISPGEIILELTETAFVNNINVCSNALGKLRDLGIEIALDDFGTGYSSLSRLNNLPLEYLKIDKSFIDFIDHSNSTRELVKYIVDLAGILELKTIAEGVERREQMDILRELGCNYIQGYYFSKPMAGNHIEEKFLPLEDGI